MSAIRDAAVYLCTYVMGLRGRTDADAQRQLKLWGPIADAAERELAETTAREVEGVDLEVGREYDVELRIVATCTDRSDAHGLCFELALEHRDFSGGRTLSVDEDEIVRASRR